MCEIFDDTINEVLWDLYLNYKGFTPYSPEAEEFYNSAEDDGFEADLENSKELIDYIAVYPLDDDCDWLPNWEVAKLTNPLPIEFFEDLDREGLFFINSKQDCFKINTHFLCEGMKARKYAGMGL